MEHSLIDNMVGHKISLNKFKKIDDISIIFSDDNGLKLEINIKKKPQKHSNTWMLNNMLLNNDWVNSEIKDCLLYTSDAADEPCGV